MDLILGASGMATQVAVSGPAECAGVEAETARRIVTADGVPVPGISAAGGPERAVEMALRHQ
jgi:hypothetical protein